MYCNLTHERFFICELMVFMAIADEYSVDVQNSKL